MELVLTGRAESLARIGDPRSSNERLPVDSALLRITGLTVRYDAANTTAVSDVDFDVMPSERVALIGESGSGKSTICLAVAGFLPATGVSATATSAQFDGTPFEVAPTTGWLPKRRPGLAITFQDAMTSLDPVWTVGSQVAAVLRSAGTPRAQRRSEAIGWLERVGLPEPRQALSKRPYELSGGMRQRVMLALVLASRPRLLIADEPTSALDSRLAHDMMTLLVELTTSTATALLVVSHDIELAREYCDRTIVMYGGRIVESGPSERVLTAPRHPYTAGLVSSVPTLATIGASRLSTIPMPQGTDPAVAPSGCPFRFRCPRATATCREVPARTVDAQFAHAVSCWHPEESPL